MAKALFGAHVDAGTLRLLDEVRVLRRRVAELEAALAAAESLRDVDDRDAVEADHDLDEATPVIV